MVSGLLHTSGIGSLLTLLTHTQDLMYALDVGPIPAVLLPSTCTRGAKSARFSAVCCYRCRQAWLHVPYPRRDIHSRLVSRPHRHGASQRCIVGVPHRIGRQALDSLPNRTCSRKAKSVCERLHGCQLQLQQDTHHCRACSTVGAAETSGLGARHRVSWHVQLQQDDLHCLRATAQSGPHSSCSTQASVASGAA